MKKFPVFLDISTINTADGEALPVDEINALFKGKECLSEISQNILKNNIYNYLISFQYDAQDRRKVCNALEFNSKEILIQESKIAILSEK